ncbi:MAG: thymidylate kinase [Bacteroidales bacterium]|jgi:dTMP kinase|nr:thymidylate kinase [Bacteroidales bacterium]
MLIVLEGLDGAGKSTQVNMLGNFIKSRGLKLKYMHFPRYDESVYGNLIAKFLRGDFGTINEVHPQLVALLYAEDRRVAAPVLRKWLEDGYCVLLDRYVYSNIAYQCSKIKDAAEADDLRNWIMDLEYVKFGIPRPDINLFLDVPIGFVSEKLGKTRAGDDRRYLNGQADIHEADMKFQSMVRDVYLRQTALDPLFVRIECSGSDGKMLSPEKIFSGIAAALK